MKKLLTATAAGALLSGAAFAQGSDGVFATVTIENGVNYLASDLMGTRVYAAEQEFEPGVPVAAGAAAEWDDIGEIGDVVVSADGSLDAIVLDVGGFLGIGEREVAVNWSAIRPVVEDDDPDDVFLVVNTTREVLEGAPEVERQTNVALDTGVAGTGATMTGDETAVMAEGTEAEMVEEENVEVVEAEDAEAMDAENVEVVEADDAEMVEAENVEVVEADDAEMTEMDDAEMAETDDTVVTTETVEVETAEAPEAEAEVAEEGTLTVVEDDTVDPAAPRLDGERTMLRTPAFEREGYETVMMDELTTEDMTGMRIYGAQDEDIGEISELVMSEDGQSIERAILDIGGFLGLGEHQVAVTLDELQIMRDEGGLNRAYIDATQEELEAQPEYEPAL